MYLWDDWSDSPTGACHLFYSTSRHTEMWNVWRGMAPLELGTSSGGNDRVCAHHAGTWSLKEGPKQPLDYWSQADCCAEFNSQELQVSLCVSSPKPPGQGAAPWRCVPTYPPNATGPCFLWGGGLLWGKRGPASREGCCLRCPWTPGGSSPLTPKMS